MPALDSMNKKMAAKLDELGLEYKDIQQAATPRRLTIAVNGLVDRQPDRVEKFMGPSKKAAFDGDNNPTKAAIGFAASKGASVEELQLVNTPKGEYVVLEKESTGEETVSLLSSLIPEIILGLTFPKSMRWGDNEKTFARPIHWFLAVYGGKTIPFTINSVTSSSTTIGHRFMSPETVEVSSYDQYLDKLREMFVLADCDERRKAVASEIDKGAKTAGGKILKDEELVDTVTNLVEKPYGICGTFDDRFLALPDAVLITSMREHQKYFNVVGDNGKLLPYFVAVNNTDVKDAKSAAEGHQRVIRARLEDAFFFYEEDKNKTLSDRVKDLSGIIFHSKLGTMLEKTERIQKLAGELASELAPEKSDDIMRTAYLTKTDLLTEMVNEFPSLQGVMGKEYALLDGEVQEVATAIVEHYIPVRAGESVPSGIVGAVVGLADRLDSITGCFGVGQIPTGTTDPYGLRRLALGFLHIVQQKSMSFSLECFVGKSLDLYADKLTEDLQEAKLNTLNFIKGRFANDLISRGISNEAVEAVTSISFDDVLDCKAKIEALESIKSEPAFSILAGSFKRVMNIIKDNKDTQIELEMLSEDAEKKLYASLENISKEVKPHLDNKEYVKALEIILQMKDPVDNFFDDVMVMADNLNVRQNRLNLLSAIAQLFLQIGDFSKMQVPAQ